MAVIGYRVFGDGTSAYLSLQNEEFVRRLGWGNSWQKIRIGLLYAISNAATFTLNQFGVGVCSGNSVIENTTAAKSTTSTNVYMAGPAGQGGAGITFTYNSGPPAYFSSATQIRARKRVNTWANGGSSAGASLFHAAVGSGNRSFMFHDFDKGTGQVNSYYPTSSGLAQTNYNMVDLLQGVQQTRVDTLNIRGSLVTAATGSGTITGFDETAGPLDCLDIYWGLGSFPVEIYGIVVYATWQNSAN